MGDYFQEEKILQAAWAFEKESNLKYSIDN
jgi:hypothetical protein